MRKIEVECMDENSNDGLVRVKDARKVAYARREMVMSVQEAKVLVDDLMDVITMAENELANRHPGPDDDYVIRHYVRYSFRDNRGNLVTGLCKAFDKPGDAEKYRVELILKAARDSLHCHNTYYIERMIINDD